MDSLFSFVFSFVFAVVYFYTRYIAVPFVLAIAYWVLGLFGTSKRMRIGLTLLAGPILIWRYWYMPPMLTFDSVSDYWPALLGAFLSVVAEAPMVIGLGVSSMAIGAALCAMEVRKKRSAKDPSEDFATRKTDRAPLVPTGTEAPGQQQNLVRAP